MAFDESAPLGEVKFRQLTGSGHIDTVLLAFTDLHGRLQGKRLHAKHFLATGMFEGTTVPQSVLGLSAHESDAYDESLSVGDEDFRLIPDMSTLRPAPWLPSTALVQCDIFTADGSPVVYSPRQILRTQIQRAAAMGFEAIASLELEFALFEESYEEAWHSGYRQLTSANRHSADHSILGSSRVEPMIRDIRNSVYNAGLNVQASKGSAAPGQFELAFSPESILKMADEQVVFKTAAKEIAMRHGRALTFMAKTSTGLENSCHLHLNLRQADGETVFGVKGRQPNPLLDAFLGGVVNTLLDFTLLYAPTVNSYKRFQPEAKAPTAIAWGFNNRTCAVRVVGTDEGVRVENRLPGGDINPYLALAGMLAAGLTGIQNRLSPGAAFDGDADAVHGATMPITIQERQERGLPPGPPQLFDAEQLGAKVLRAPISLAQGRDLFAASPLARSVFGAGVVDQLVRLADAELMAFEAAVTDWEMFRNFEQR